jgi:hypothetical protein
MGDQDRPGVPVGIEDLVAGLGELETLFGDAARAVVPTVQARLREAMAARDRGDPVATVQAIGAAMQQLADLADRLDPQDGMLMRTVADRFRVALLGDDLPEAKHDLDIMFERSGARYRKPPR